MLWRARLWAPISYGRHSILQRQGVCVAGAAFRSYLKGWDVMARAAMGPISCDKRSTLEIQMLKSWQTQYFVRLVFRYMPLLRLNNFEQYLLIL